MTSYACLKDCPDTEHVSEGRGLCEVPSTHSLASCWSFVRLACLRT